ncbi:hypothetical protein [Halorhabdus amylolytica]|uniref:hypothetical protein n=1 Tax=Halorhabdus amylolytica TaxID=2559573 RepID=UPI0010AA5210|nr:hypothetical protein [Halorhabdus amylolytica]
MRSIRRPSLAIGIGALLIGVATVAGWIYALSTPWAEGSGFVAGWRWIFAMVGIASGVVAVGCAVALLAVERFLSPSSTERKLLVGGASMLAIGVLVVHLHLAFLWYVPVEYPRRTWMVILGILAKIGAAFLPLGFILAVSGLLLVVASTRRDGHAPPGRTLVRISAGMVLFGIALLGLSNGLRMLGWRAMGGLPATLGGLLLPIGVPTLIVGGLLTVIARWRGSPAR